MSNRILHIDLRYDSRVPAAGEVLITVVPQFVDSGTEVRGRLMGPRCRFASTVEVAYHLRRILVPTSQPAFTFKAVIPEASLWEPESPHLYAGPIELWQEGLRCAVVPVRHGLRHVALGPRGLRLNSKPIRLKGFTKAACNDEEALALRLEGYNLLLTPVSEESRHVWEVADRLGFFVLGIVDTCEQAKLTHHLTGHPCCLGWILGGEAIPPEELAAAALVGSLEGKGSPAEQMNFAILPAESVALADAHRPVLVMGGRFPLPAGESGPVILGSVE